MNPWHEKLGCEVNVCQSKEPCDPERMKVCALRKAWQERIAKLTMDIANTRTEIGRHPLMQMLKGLKDYE